MSTYSNGHAYPTEADKLEDINSVMNGLPDNTNHYITPKGIRNSIFTTWENIIFKPTTIPISTVEYVGIDQENFIEKILIGRKVNKIGNYVLNDNLLKSDGDIFLSNSSTGSNVNLVFLAGTGSNYYASNIFAPKIAANVVISSDGKYVNLDISNNQFVSNGTTAYGGDINITSNYGKVSLNNIVLPTLNNTDNNALPGSILSIDTISSGVAYMKWYSMSTASATASLYYTNPSPIPTTVGGIQSGSTFSSVSLIDMFNRLLYPYLPPTLTLSMNVSYIEVGNSVGVNSLFLTYDVGRHSTYSISTFVSTSGGISSPPSSSLPSIGNPGSLTGTSSVIFTNNQILFANDVNTKTFTMSISDTKVTWVTQSTSVGVNLPWYWGSAMTYSNLTSTLNSILSMTYSTVYSNYLTPQLVGSGNKTVTYQNGTSYLYFGYPSSYPDITSIIDSTGDNIFSTFQKFTYSLVTSPNSWWSGKTYKFYIYTGLGVYPITTTLPTSYSMTFKF